MLKNSRPTLVDFYAEWCHACKDVKGPLEQLAKSYGKKVDFRSYDVGLVEDDDDFEKKYIAYGGRRPTIPALLMFYKGKVACEVRWDGDEFFLNSSFLTCYRKIQ